MDFIKNFLALVISTAVWSAGFLAILSLYYIFTEKDIFYFWIFLICILALGLGVLLGKFNIRVQTALEIPMGLLGL
jgi:hypothetical protein